MKARTPRAQLLRLATLFQGGLLLASVLIGTVSGHYPWQSLELSWSALGVGVLATLPMLLFLVVAFRSESRGMVEIRAILREVLGESLIDCRWYHLAYIALLAGVTEESLFRGALEPWIWSYNVWAGVLITNLAFGLCHAVTPMYFVVATGIGIYLSLTLRMTGEPNLLVPVTAHALYDLVAFFVIRDSLEKQASPMDSHSIAIQQSEDVLGPPD